MKIPTRFAVLALITSCYVHSPPPPSYAPQPGYATQPSHAPPPAMGSLSGRWQVTAVVPAGQPYAGPHTTTWEINDSGGQLWANGVWSNGARSRYTGWVRSGTVHFDRTDDNGFRGAFDGSLSADGGTMSGAGRNDPTSPSGNSAAYTWTAQRIGAGPSVAAAPPPPQPPPPAPAAVALSGRWQVTCAVNPPLGGTHTTTWDITDVGGQLSGSSVWSNGARSRYAGWVRGAAVHLDRTDDNGFRGSFDGSLGPGAGAMSGSGLNDPSSPSGNNATYSWTARRM